MTTIYKVKVGEKEFEVRVDEIAPDKYRVKVNGYELEVSVEEIEKEIPKVKQITKEIPKAPEIPKVTRTTSTITQSSIPITSKPKVKEIPKEAKGHEIRSSVPGKVLRVLVKPGDRVKPKDVIITLESMKMELEIYAGREGIVKEIKVKSGDSVNAGDVIAIIE